MEIFASLGKKNRFMDEIIATFSSRWKSQKDYFQLLGGQILSIAATGNVIIIGRGSSVIAQELKNCFHFRMYASHEFKVKSIARRAKISPGEADALIDRRQKERDKFVRDFLDCDARDLRYYHLVFNNDKNPADRIAKMIVSYVFP